MYLQTPPPFPCTRFDAGTAASDRGPSTTPEPVLPRCSRPDGNGIAAVAAVGLVVSPKYRELQSGEREEKQPVFGSMATEPGGKHCSEPTPSLGQLFSEGAAPAVRERY